ncbi:fatty acid CoA ligase FadD9 [Nocardia sp. GAS34]|uniref:carboxylic acid reductase n=1 Tax=unclassified Nocardia TaxID=2637762 RepID=UPI003D21AC29
MSTDTGAERLARRIQDLSATDAQFAAARPDEAITAAIQQPGLRLPQLVQTVMDGYADRPALGQRAVQFVTDPATGRTAAQLLARFETITYAELWDRAGAIAAAWTNESVRPGDRVCVLGFASMDYATVDLALMRLGAVAVPLQTGAGVTQLRSIVAEAEPTVIAASIDQLSTAVDLILTGDAPARLVVFDYHGEVDDHSEAIEAARARLAEAGGPAVAEILADVVARGKRLPAVPAFVSGEPDPVRLLIYTSGSTGAPKGAMYPERLIANLWRRSRGPSWPNGAASITLNFVPMSHAMGRHIVYGSLGSGGTAYFAAKPDMSTLFEDLALVRPTDVMFVPRVWEMLFDEYHRRLDRRSVHGTDQETLNAEVTAELSRNLFGGRVVSAITGSASLSAEVRAWAERSLDLHVLEMYGSTEDGFVFVDGRVQRPPMLDYKLADVPELGYLRTDQPHPRGELLVKSEDMFAGYYKRPDVTAEVYDADGYYRTGDIFAEIAPGIFQFTDRRNNVIKLSQGEFVAVSKLAAVFETSPLVHQIYLYGNSARPYLLAVIVPTGQALADHAGDELKPLISASLQDVAKAAGLRSYEIPRDFLIEPAPFSQENGLLTGIGKIARPILKQRYGQRLERLYDDLAQGQDNELRRLRREGGDQPVLQTIRRAAAALLGTADTELRPDAQFSDLGGDSLSALTFANLLHEIFGIDVPVGVIISSAADLQTLADYIQAQRQPGAERPAFAGVHGRAGDGEVTEVAARDLTLDKFIDAATLAAAPTLPRRRARVRTVLLTGATGFLGRFLALEWLERLAPAGGTLICLVRGKDDTAARARLDRTFDSGDPVLLAHYRELAAQHLQVIAGDKSELHLGLDQQTWQRLADIVDLIVDPAALVNHVLPYIQLFGPNVVGTAELIRLALTTRIKPYGYVSTLGVGDQIPPSQFTETADIRTINPTRRLDDSYANGYNTSKWASEVLLREANDRCGLPVAVFRCDMIMTDTEYVGQLNVPDIFTRLMLSLVATGIAPYSFYELDKDGNRQRAHYDGLPVDFIAEAIAALGTQLETGVETYHVANPYDDGIGLDQYVDWLIAAGHPIQRIPDYHDWLDWFETAMRALPDRQRQHSVLPLLRFYQQPAPPLRGAPAPAERFHTAVQEAKIGPDKDIPHITTPIIVKYITNLQQLGLL